MLVGSVVIALAGLSFTVSFIPMDWFDQEARLVGALPTAFIMLTLALALMSLGMSADRATGLTLLPTERLAVAMAAILIVSAPTLLIQLVLPFAHASGLQPMTAVLLASALNTPIVIHVLGVGLHFLGRQREILIATERRLSLATEAHRISLFAWDLERDVVQWSGDTELRFGLKPGTITNFASWAQFVHVDDAAQLQRQVAEAAKRKDERFSFRYRFTRPDDEVRQIEGSAQLIYTETGAIGSAIGVNVDVTDSERDKAQLQSILETVPAAMIVIDERGSVTRFSSAAVKIFGWSEAEIVGRNVSVLMPQAHAAAHDGWLRRYLGGAAPRVMGQTRHLRGLRKDGTTFPMQAHVGETRVAGERLFTGFIEDITEQVETTRRLEALRTEYMHADRATAMGEIAAGLAHELNQPLAAAATYLGVAELTAEEADGRSAEAMTAARSEILRAGAIIRRLRDFLAKNEADMAEQPLIPILTDAIQLALVGQDRSRFEVSVDADRHLCVLADRVQIQQVLVNLLRNAAEAVAPMHQCAVTIACRSLDGGMVEVEVCDNGPGLPQMIISRLSQPFESTKGRGGMGVGLSICRRIIEAHEGTFVAGNRTSGGACVRFTIPGASPEIKQA